MRPNRSIKYPYQEYKGLPCPIIPIEINDSRVDVYVDSGAFVSIFSIQEAEALQIDYQKGQPGSAVVGDGSVIPIFYHLLKVKIGNIFFQLRLDSLLD